MSRLPGKKVPPEEVGNLRPDEVLYEFDGPRIFTTRDSKNRMLLAYSYAEEGNRSRFFVVPFSSRQQSQLEEGTRPVREALAQSWVWDAEVEHSPDGPVTTECFEISFDDIPQNLLPRPGTMLLPHLQPLVSVRLSGEDAQPGNIKPGVIQKAVSAAVGAVRELGAYVTRKSSDVGAALEGLFDLRASHVALASFEIGFRESTAGRGGEGVASVPPTTELVRAEQAIAKEEALAKVGDLLSRGLHWAVEEVDTDVRGREAFENKEERTVVLQAIRRLTSSISATVSQVQVGGRLVSGHVRRGHGPEQQEVGPVALDRTAQIRVEIGIEGPAKKKKTEEAITIEGRLAVSDKDKYSFVLRDVSGPKSQWRCRYPKKLHSAVMDAYFKDVRVRVVGIPKVRIFKVDELHPVVRKKS